MIEVPNIIIKDTAHNTAHLCAGTFIILIGIASGNSPFGSNPDICQCPLLFKPGCKVKIEGRD